MTTSLNGRALIESFEGCVLKAYQDQRGIWTIGYGHTGAGVVADLICTQEQADVWLAQDLLMTETAIEHLLPTDLALSQNQFDALVSLVYNIGSGDFQISTVRRKLSQVPPDYQGAADAIKMWNKTGGVVNPGLVRRRAAEIALFNTPDAIG
jgi:lysozyme